ncbi:MAG: NYN domain-containing protein [Chloroflexi bacterium]|nr:NYN domain-containing protein [Chloroflexota bacterium]
MSKNVAVFVDVANIFYAAKAAGVDIDYVTLLKASTANRDFVRAYAYTGLDPDNENQRQFHSFLSRSGYKVVSKDIRKYGDGRIKANLDIELVVDLMRMAQHIDIAVVVSGDGDFAPAIRAVQQMGVRVEVVSFRGNTSSDLIEVADVFTDIAQLARVERGERSGRRVASDDDLSMTAVPEKETDTGTRRRRSDGRRTDRSERAERGERARRPAAAAATVATEVEVAAAGSNLIVLPGERLSRAPADEAVGEPPEEGGQIIELPDQDGDAEAGEGEGEGRRRRRRRGGRGRGRGRRGEGEVAVVGESAEAADLDAETEVILEDELLEEEVALLPQHSTFGSVWESQIGTSTPVAPVAGTLDDDEAYDDEPEIPEYLLAERRQQGRGRQRGGRNQSGGRGGQAGYRSAIDRERFGRGGAPSSGGYGRADAGRSSGRSSQGGQARPQQQRPARPAPVERTERPTGSAEPWSEVPADVQELLKAEMARRQGGGKQRSDTAERPSAVAVEVVETSADEPAKKPTRRRSTKAAAAAEPVVETPAETPAEEAPAKKPVRRRSTKAAAAEPVVETPAPVEDAPAKPTRRRSTKAAAAAEPVVETPAETPAEEAPVKKPVRRRSTKAAADPATGDA